MPTHSHARLLERAAEILGGAQALQAFLRAPAGQLERWMQGKSTLPTYLFLKLVDLVSDHTANGRSRIHERYEALRWRQELLSESSAKKVQAARDAIAQAREISGWSVVLRAARVREHDMAEMAKPKHRLFDSNFAPRDRAELLETALDATLELAGTDLGNVQLIDSDGALRIQTHRGFEKPFLEFFSVVSQPECACGVAMSIGRQVFIPDARRNAMFMGTDAGTMLENAGARAVTSSPLVHDSGLVVGMISTHYRKPCAKDQAELASLELVARRAASWLDVLTASE